MSFFKRKSQAGSNASATKALPALPLTPLQLLLGDTPTRTDGSDKYFGFENYGNTCYCNSIMQCLYNSKAFREAVINYPQRSIPLGAKNPSLANNSAARLSRIVSEPPIPGSPNAKKGNGALTGGPDLKRRGSLPSNAQPPNPQNMRPEDKDSPEYKKKMAMQAGPVLNVDNANSRSYGMEENLFTALKDLFESVVGSESKTGVVSPHRFLEVLKQKNEMFRGQMHQDAHEFLNYVLNEVVDDVEAHYKAYGKANGIPPPLVPRKDDSAPAAATGATTQSEDGSTAGWVHDLFEGALTSETKCLTCENLSRRDEPFLDLSIDLEKHSSVTSCLRNFSASEMLCERNKFHCDGCGGLQEAEKRMKIRRLPRILALHLKRFKYVEELQRHQKLFHRVVYPYHLRLFNTTDDAEDPDRLYELYAVVVHIGGGPYHGHYVSIVKTEEKGWLLYDDEMVEPVDKSYVRNFFGDKAGLACAYVLFYQETTLEAIQKEDVAGRTAPVTQASDIPTPADIMNGWHGTNGINGHADPRKPSVVNEEADVDTPTNSTPEDPSTPLVKPQTPIAALSRVSTLASTAPLSLSSSAHNIPVPPIPASPGPNNFSTFSNRLSTPTGVSTPTTIPASPVKSKKEREREKKEEKEREKAAKKDEKEKEREKDHDEGHSSSGGGLRRFRPGSMSMSGKKAFSWAAHGKDKEKSEKDVIPPTPVIPDYVAAGSMSSIAVSTSDTLESQRSNVALIPTSAGPPVYAAPTTPVLNGILKTKEKEKEKEKKEKKDKHAGENDTNGGEPKHHRLGLRKKLSILG